MRPNFLRKEERHLLYEFFNRYTEAEEILFLEN